MTEQPTGQITKALGHVALHFRNAEDGPAAARLLQMFGYGVVQEIPLPNGTNFYQFSVDRHAPLNGSGILYLSRVSDQQLALHEAIHQALKVGQPQEHPAVAAMRAAQVNDPEVGFHVGVLMQSLEELEAVVERIREASNTDPALKDRIKIIANRARRGDPKIDARMDASPVFGRTSRECYGKYGCQAFIETSLLCSGPLGENLVLELDYVFPGYPEHMFNKTMI